MNRDEAEQLTSKIKAAATHIADLAQLAYDNEVWRILEYESWEDYCKGSEFDHRVKLKPDARRQEVQKMTEHGMSTRAQAAVLGVGATTVRNDQGQIAQKLRNLPDRIKRRNGGTYPAQRQKPRHVAPITDEDHETNMEAVAALSEGISIAADEMLAAAQASTVGELLADTNGAAAILQNVALRLPDVVLDDESCYMFGRLGAKLSNIGNLMQIFVRGSDEFDEALNAFLEE